MKFPITREQLHNIKKDVEEDLIEYNIEKVIDLIKLNIVMHAYQGSHLGGITKTKLRFDISKFRIIIPDKWPHIIINSSIHPLASFNPWKTHFEIIKEKLMELFPGVSFETDPLKTYILIDWS